MTRQERERASYRLKTWIKKDRAMTETDAVEFRLDRMIAMLKGGVKLSDAEDLLAHELWAEDL